MPPWLSAFLGRGARLRGKGLPIFCHLSCHDATTHHTMLEDLRSPQQVHPLAAFESDGNPTQSGASRAAAPEQQTSSPPPLASSASRHHLLLLSVFPQCADRLPLHRGCRRPAPSSSVRDLGLGLSIHSQINFSFRTTLHLFSTSRRYRDTALQAQACSRTHADRSTLHGTPTTGIQPFSPSDV